MQFFGFDGGGTPAQPGVSDFVGYRQHAGTEPVGYRGTSVPAPVLATEQGNDAEEEQLLAADFSTTAQNLEEAARLLTRLTEHLRNG